MPPHAFKIRRPRLPDPLPPDETPYVPDTAPVVETRSGVMTRVWLEWARRVTGLAAHGAAGTGGGTPDPHAPTHEPGGADPLTVDAAPGVGSLRTLGPGANQAAPGNDTRFTTPAAHHATHEPGGADALANAAWTNQANTFTQDQTISADPPALLLNMTSAPANARLWWIRNFNNLSFSALDDATGVQSQPLVLERDGDAFIGNNLTVNGSGGNVACKDQANTFTQNQTLSAANPSVVLTDTAQPANSRVFYIGNAAQTLVFTATNDVFGSPVNPLALSRSGDAYVGRDVLEKGRATPLGHWINVPFSAGNFVGLGGTWTVGSGDVVENRYTLIGKTAIYVLIINGSSTSGAASQLSIVNPVPGGAAGYYITMCRLGSADVISAYANAGDAHIYLIRPGIAAFPASPGSIWFTITMSIS